MTIQARSPSFNARLSFCYHMGLEAQGDTRLEIKTSVFILLPKNSSLIVHSSSAA